MPRRQVTADRTAESLSRTGAVPWTMSVVALASSPHPGSSPRRSGVRGRARLVASPHPETGGRAGRRQTDRVHARSALFDLYGDHLGPRGGQAPVAALVRLLEPLGVA